MHFGTHKALRRFTEFARSSRYILQGDISKYFPNIDHAILKQVIRKRPKCADTLWLIDLIIDHSRSVSEGLVGSPFFPMRSCMESRGKDQ